MDHGPRIPPRPADDWDDETRDIVESTSGLLGQDPLNIFRTLAHHPKLLKRWLVFGNSLLGKGIIDARLRELAILRTGWNCRSEYEFGQHVLIGRMVGVDDDQIRRVVEGPDAGWEGLDRAVLRAADELHAEQRVGDETWAELAAELDEAQLIELVMVVGQYHLVAMTLNSAGVELDEGVPSFADLGLGG